MNHPLQGSAGTAMLASVAEWSPTVLTGLHTKLTGDRMKGKHVVRLMPWNAASAVVGFGSCT